MLQEGSWRFIPLSRGCGRLQGGAFACVDRISLRACKSRRKRHEAPGNSSCRLGYAGVPHYCRYNGLRANPHSRLIHESHAISSYCAKTHICVGRERGAQTNRLLSRHARTTLFARTLTHETYDLARLVFDSCDTVFRTVPRRRRLFPRRRVPRRRRIQTAFDHAKVRPSPICLYPQHYRVPTALRFPTTAHGSGNTAGGRDSATWSKQHSGRYASGIWETVRIRLFRCFRLPVRVSRSHRLFGLRWHAESGVAGSILGSTGSAAAAHDRETGAA